MKKNENDTQVVQNQEIQTKPQKLPISFYFNILSMLLFLFITIWGMAKKDYAHTSFRYVAISFVVIYSVVLIGLIIYMLIAKNNNKQMLKDMKTAGKTFKSTLAILNKIVVLINIIAALAISITQYQAAKEAGSKIPFSFYISIIASIFALTAAISFIFKKSRKIYKSNKKLKKNN